MKYLIQFFGDEAELAEKEFCLRNETNYIKEENRLILTKSNYSIKDKAYSSKKFKYITKRSYDDFNEILEELDEIKTQQISEIKKIKISEKLKEFTTDLKKNFELKDNFSIEIEFLKNKKEIYQKLQAKKKEISQKKIISNFGKSLDITYDEKEIELKNPSQIIYILFSEQVYFLELLEQNKREDLKKRNKNLISNHPSTISAIISKATMNLIDLKKEDVFLDPFCGTGGFLIDASKITPFVYGMDLSNVMLTRSVVNLTYFHLKNNVKLIKANSIKKENIQSLLEIINKDIKNKKKEIKIATDFPYGKNSKISEPILDLFSNFMKTYSEFEQITKILFILPAFIRIENYDEVFKRYTQIIEKTPFEIIYTHKIHVHKSLSRILFLIERKKE